MDWHPVHTISILQQRRNRFNSIPETGILFKFRCLHAVLRKRPFLHFQRYGKLAYTLEDFWMTMHLVRTSCTFFSFKGKKNLSGLLVIPAGSRSMSGRTACYFSTIITELKSSHDRIHISAGQIRCDQVNVVFRSSADVSVSAIGTVSDHYGFLFLITDTVDVFFQEFTVALIVGVELVVCYD